MTSLDDELADLVTESVNPAYALLDTMSVAELAEAMNQADASVAPAVHAVLPDITAAIEATAERMQAGGRLVYVGAGTAGRIGVVDASECPPTFSTPPEQVFAIMAGGSNAIVRPTEGAEDDATAGARAVDEAAIAPTDTVVGIASSGRTPYVLGAIERARELGALTVGLSCNTGTRLSATAELAIEIELGPEVISGSTRLKAGTAQKMVLNMFSTIVMVRLGKTYGNLMVDLKATNHKLRERAIRMVELIAQVPRDVAAAALEGVDFDVKLASLMLIAAIDREAAASRLGTAGGRLRTALELS
jgi:N-acetylmuramic acid 6-phosphate etherase